MKKLIGNKAFYSHVLVIAIPIIIQNAITNFVGLLDNIMIGQLGTLAMSGVSIANSLFNVFYLTVFGALSGAGIFAAQFAGKKDQKGTQDCFHFQLYIGLIIFFISLAIFMSNGTNLLKLYLSSGNNVEESLATLNYGLDYLKIMLLGLLPFILSQVYAQTARVNGDTVLPMISSVVAVLSNFVLNYALIFGHFGLPELGVQGAAIATIISRYIEFAIVGIGSHITLSKHSYLKGIYSFFAIPLDLTIKIIKRGFPLLCNEILWSVTMAWIMQCYSVRGLDAVASINIMNTVVNVFMIVCYAMGNTITIIVGQELGAGKTKQAYETDLKMMFLTFMICVVSGTGLLLSSKAIPQVYNTSDYIKELSTTLLIISALTIPIQGIYFASYFTMRTGGKTVITFLFDSLYTTVINLPIAFILAHYTGLNIIMIYLIVRLTDLPKAILGTYLVVKGIWVNNLVGQE